MDVEIHGTVADGFEPVRDTFAGLWQDIEIGASFCAWYQGEKVIDIWGGYTDEALARPWQEDTLCNIYSTTKGLAALVLAVLFDERLIDYEEPVITYWPEFGAEGKQDITVAQLLSHQAGLAGVETKLTVEDLYNWDRMVNLLAAQKPLWGPGTASGYHSITWGFLAGELVRRTTGRTLGQYFREKVAEPLGAAHDCFIGLPDSEMGRVATLNGPNRARNKPPATTGPENATSADPALQAIAQQNPVIQPYRHACSPEWRRAEIAAANGQGNARGVATIYAALSMGGELNGIRIISNDAITAATKIEIEGSQTDLVLGRPLRRARGFILNNPANPGGGIYGPQPDAFGHTGAGGSAGFADRTNQVAISYVMNQMAPGASATPRSPMLARSFYDCLPDCS